MPIVRIEHRVPDFGSWKQVFDSDPADRKGSGVRRYSILHLHDDPNCVMIDLDFDTVEEAGAFHAKMKKIWNGPGRSLVQGPSGRIAELVEVREI
jgi:hypothetical protein